jgi:iron-sulfur cluster repair protein YtfE (RIC family)
MNLHSKIEGDESSPIAVDPALSINEILRLHPVATQVLNAFGVDTCCGGAMSLADAAAEAQVSCDDVSFAIGQAIIGARVAAARA